MTTQPESAPETTATGDESALGDAGKRALAAEREARRKAEDALKAARAQLRDAQLRSAAAGKLHDPADAARLLDVASLAVGEDGTYDPAALGAAIDALTTSKPYLAPAAPKPGFQGTGDGGAAGRTTVSGVSQLSRSDLKGMSAQQIAEANRAGRLRDIMGGGR